MLAQAFGDRQHQVGRGDAFLQLARQLEADDVGNQHRGGLAEHRGLGLDAADAPPHHAQPVHHRRVRVGAEEGVGEDVGLPVDVLAADDAREVLDIDLVDDARARRHDAEVRERVLAPAQELVALAVALVLEIDVEREAVALAEVVDLHRVVDDQFYRLQRVDAGRVASELDHAVTHRREVDHGRDTREVLEQDAGGHERDLALGATLDIPPGEGGDVLLLDEGAVFLAQQVLQQDAQRVRQRRDPGEPGRLEGRQAVVVDGLASDRESAPRLEGVGHTAADRIKTANRRLKVRRAKRAKRAKRQNRRRNASKAEGLQGFRLSAFGLRFCRFTLFALFAF